MCWKNTASRQGDAHEGVLYANNMCPSHGTMDIFVEPILPRPQLYVCGASPVAVAIAAIAPRMGFFVSVCAPVTDHALFGEADRLVDGYEIPPRAAMAAMLSSPRRDVATLRR